MELLQLKYFQKVAQREHLTNAARELNISQPSLSKTIARLEEELGVPLFDRQRRQIRLNTYGKTFLKQVETALGALEEGRREITDQAGLERGRIVLDTATVNRISDSLGSFLSLHPYINLQINRVTSQEMQEQMLINREIDFCITCAPIERPEICSLPLMTQEILLAVAPTHRFAGQHNINLSQVADDPFISFKEGFKLREFTDELCRKAGFEPRIVCDVDEVGSIIGLIRTGLGSALLPASIRETETSLVFLHINDPSCRRTFKLIWLANRYLSQASRALSSFLVQNFAYRND